MAANNRQSNALLAWSWLWLALLVLLGATFLAWWQDPLPVPPNREPQAWSFWKPIETNPHRRLVTIKGNLNSVTFAEDGLRGWAVGDRGMIITTNDGGKTWTAQSVPFTVSTMTVINEDKTSKEQAYETIADIRSIHFHSDNLHGLAVGRSIADGEIGSVYATVDGGKTWAQQNSENLSGLRSAYFHTDGLHGWAVGDRSIMATTDGGKTWEGVYLSLSYRVIQLNFVYFNNDGLHGWVVGSEERNALILSTTDGGKNWATQRRNRSEELLSSIFFHADGLRGWAVGIRGIILATRDGGKTWAPQISNTSKVLHSIHFNADGLRGWVVGVEGTILSTGDGGKNWIVQKSNTSMRLTYIHFHTDGLHGWTVGWNGTILSTSDGGVTWVPQSYEVSEALSSPNLHAAPYRRLPAPWYWLVVALSAWLGWLSWRLRPNGLARESIANVAASDAEVRLASEDRLEFIGLARGISRFLRNAETRPPLTLAITGDWGSGKSSLMQLVCADLRASGHRPIWFNAWHHQKEEHLFAALLGAVYAQAVPSLWSWQGVNFRLRLLWLRSKQHFGVLMLVVMAMTIAIVVSLPALQQGKFKDISDNFASLQQWGAPVLAGLTALFALWKGMRPFGVNPALLLTRLRDNLSLRAASAQNDFRAQFARQFGELVQALPYRLVLVIDDLDRCRPSAVLDVMETVNYLTSAGECFVIFGMASERVQAALGLAFKDIAAELVQMEGGVHLSEANADSALMKRRAYAADYLQKLVNIEIKVPDTHDQPVHQLLATPEAAPRRRVLSVYYDLKKLSPLFAVGIAVAAGLWMASYWQPQAQAPTPVMTVQPIVAQSAVLPAPAPVSQPVVIEPQREARPASAATVQAGETTSVGTMLAWLGAAMLPLLAVGVLVLVKLLRRSRLVTRDSQNFRDALAIWTGVVAAKRSTPRAIKRFGNRLRYLAMLQQGELKDETLAESLRAWLKQKIRRTHTETPPLPVDTLAEHQLIAMGAFYEVEGIDWKNRMNTIALPDFSRLVGQYSNPLEIALRAAIAKHQAEFKCSWPPTPAEIAVFEKLLSGVRLSGDPQPISPTEDVVEPTEG